MLDVSQGLSVQHIKLAECEGDHSVPSSALVKHDGHYVPPLPHICLQGMHRDNFTLFEP